MSAASAARREPAVSEGVAYPAVEGDHHAVRRTKKWPAPGDATELTPRSRVYCPPNSSEREPTLRMQCIALALAVFAPIQPGGIGRKKAANQEAGLAEARGKPSQKCSPATAIQDHFGKWTAGSTGLTRASPRELIPEQSTAQIAALRTPG